MAASQTGDGTPYNSRDLGQPRQVEKATTEMFTFSNSEYEKRFWSNAKMQELKGLEMFCLAVSCILTFTTEMLGQEHQGPEEERLWLEEFWPGPLLHFCRHLHSILLFAATCLAFKQEDFYHAHHDWIMVLLRLSSYPAQLLRMQSPCGILNLAGDSDEKWRSMLTVLSAIAVFGPCRAFIDGLRFPLRFRHHLVVQFVVLGIVSCWNWNVCNMCFDEGHAKAAIYQACQWTTLSTTGMWLDCGMAGFFTACVTFSLQLHVILGMLFSSFIIYSKELSSRLKEPNNAQHGNYPVPSSSTGQGASSHLRQD